MQKTEQEIVDTLRKTTQNEKPVVISETTGLSKNEALLEAEYIFKKMLSENQPVSPQESQKLINDTMMGIMDYFKTVKVKVEPEELFDHLLKGDKNG